MPNFDEETLLRWALEWEERLLHIKSPSEKDVADLQAYVSRLGKDVGTLTSTLREKKDTLAKARRKLQKWGGL